MLGQSVARRKTDLAIKLYMKAKSEPLFRFYSLYDKVCSFNILWKAWKAVRKKKKTSPGLDGVTIKSVKAFGEKEFVVQIRLELVGGSYVPSPLKKWHVPKENGGKD